MSNSVRVHAFQEAQGKKRSGFVRSKNLKNCSRANRCFSLGNAAALAIAAS
jgi:hypothetical protein